VDAQTGSAQLDAQSGVGGFIRFRYEPNGQEAVVPLETRNAPFYDLAFDNTNGIAAGVAIANLSLQAASVPVTIRDMTGTTLGSGSITIPPSGHSSFTLTDQFPISANQMGTIEFDTPAGGQISVLGLTISALFSFFDDSRSGLNRFRRSVRASRRGRRLDHNHSAGQHVSGAG
jgi:hypothetical protein